MKIFESVTVGQILEKGAARVPDKIAVVDGSQRKSYKELNGMADALAACLAEIGFKKGDQRPNGYLFSGNGMVTITLMIF